MEKAEAFAGLMYNRFHPLGDCQDAEIEEDFGALARLVDRCDCFSLPFSDPIAAGILVAERLGKARGTP